MQEKSEHSYRVEFIAMQRALSRALRVHPPTTITQVLSTMALQSKDSDNLKLKRLAEIVSDAFNTTPVSMFTVSMNSDLESRDARIAFLFVVQNYTMEDVNAAKALFIRPSSRSMYRWIKAAHDRMYGPGKHTHQDFHKKIELIKAEIDNNKALRRPDK